MCHHSNNNFVKTYSNLPPYKKEINNKNFSAIPEVKRGFMYMSNQHINSNSLYIYISFFSNNSDFENTKNFVSMVI
jgi:hypothetical protein